MNSLDRCAEDMRHAYHAFTFAAERLKAALESQCGGEGVLPRIAKVQAIVAADFNIPLRSMCSASRCYRFSRPRQLAMMLARDCTSHTTAEIGRSFGGRDHGTVLHAIKATVNRMETDHRFTAQAAFTRQNVVAALKPLEFPARVLSLAAGA